MPRAKKLCCEIGCTKLCPPGESRCPEHRQQNPYSPKPPGSSRTGTKEYKDMRAKILQRDTVCRLRLPGCTQQSTDMDHIVPVAAAQLVRLTPAQLNHELNQRGVCHSCHLKHSSRQANYLKGTTSVPKPWTDADVERLRDIPSAPPSSGIPRRISLFKPDDDDDPRR